MARKRLTEADWQTIAFALNCAIEERDGLADAYSRTGPEAEKANANVARFKALHLKLFGKKTQHEQFCEEMAACRSIPITELLSTKELPHA